jgi:hypothetical protein
VRTVPRSPAVGAASGAGLGAPLARAPLARRALLPRRVWIALLGLLLAGAVVAGTLALTSGGAEHAARPALPPRIDGVSLQSANCTNWWAGSEAERRGAIAGLTRSIGGPTPYGPGTTLPDAKVHALFDRVCAPSFTRHFMLYEIYIRAAGFKSLGQ